MPNLVQILQNSAEFAKAGQNPTNVGHTRVSASVEIARCNPNSVEFGTTSVDPVKIGRNRSDPAESRPALSNRAKVGQIALNRADVVEEKSQRVQQVPRSRQNVLCESHRLLGEHNLTKLGLMSTLFGTNNIPKTGPQRARRSAGASHRAPVDLFSGQGKTSRRRPRCGKQSCLPRCPNNI